MQSQNHPQSSENKIKHYIPPKYDSHHEGLKTSCFEMFQNKNENLSSKRSLTDRGEGQGGIFNILEICFRNLK